ncbi:MAG: UDP-N-acetylmuramate--L-alanine ligase [Kineosporiaceae bacterium]
MTQLPANAAKAAKSAEVAEPVERLGAVHFIGMGGVGMSGLARILCARGVRVSGSDARDSVVLDGLRALGARVCIGHDAANLADAETVVVSSAIRPTNPELALARERGLRILHRSQALASLMVGRRAVAVAGTHGKTTTTSMLTVALDAAGDDPSFAIGGELTGATADRASAREGTGDVFVAEADESDESFLRYSPTVAIVTNVEPDHLDHYGTAEAVEAAFEAFTDRIVPGGALVCSADDDGALRLSQSVRRRRPDVEVICYGEREGSDVRLVDVRPAEGGIEVTFQPRAGMSVAGRELPRTGPLRLRVPGRHNAANAAAAWIAGCCLGSDPARLAAGLAGFGGTRRRFELKGRAAGIEVRDDYSHHPTEVAAALRGARTTLTHQAAGSAGGTTGSRIVVIFQPHLFSRTRIFATAFGHALGLADEVIVLDVYAAREDPEPGITGELITREVPLPSQRVHFAPTLDDARRVALDLTRPGDLVITMGAGDVTTLGPQLLTEWAARAERADRPGS